MAKKEETSNGSFNKAMKSLGALEVSFAQFRVGMASKARLKVYKKLASLLRNRFSLMNALDIMYDSITDNGKHPGEPMAIAIASWGKTLQNGYAFSDALLVGVAAVFQFKFFHFDISLYVPWAICLTLKALY